METLEPSNTQKVSQTNTKMVKSKHFEAFSKFANIYSKKPTGYQLQPLVNILTFQQLYKTCIETF